MTSNEGSIYSTANIAAGRSNLDIPELEAKIDELIKLCDELEKKQSSLEQDREHWLSERTRLLEKNELAKTKVEAMIMRLRALEQE
ncbi:MAG: TIGR02449 family protein [Pseudomonadales bacterium]